MHYIRSVDTNTKQSIFENEVVINYVWRENPIYAAFENPGVRKTSEKAAGAILVRSINDKPFLLLSNFHNVKNTHAEMLRFIFGHDLFERGVRVFSGRNLIRDRIPIQACIQRCVVPCRLG